MITDVGHTAFRVHDLQKSIEFYALLGIHEKFRLNHPDGSLMLAYLHVGGDRFIELFPGGTPPQPLTGSFVHLCLISTDLHADVKMLEGHGVVIDVQPQMGLDHNWQAWFKDPDGNPIELMQLSEESPQRKVAREAVR
jgi:lactoylglutathione lyase